MLSDAEYNVVHMPQGLAERGFVSGQLPPGAPSTLASKYSVKALNLLPWWSVYDWADPAHPARPARLAALAREVVQNPRMDKANVRLAEAGAPLPFVVVYLRAAVAYVTAARHVFRHREDLYQSRSEARFRLDEVRLAEEAEEAAQAEMRESFEAVRAAKAPYVEAWARVTALAELADEVYKFRLLATELEQPSPSLLGPAVAVPSAAYEPDPQELVDGRADMQFPETREFVTKAQARLQHLKDLAAAAATAGPAQLVGMVAAAEGEAELLSAVMALDDLLTGRNEAVAHELERLSEREVAELRSRFVAAMVKHQVEDKANDAPALDHMWTKLVEKNFYRAQKHFDEFKEARPKKLFLDYIRDLDASKEPDGFARALDECVWWLRQNLPQDPTVWHGDFMAYVAEVEQTVKAALEQTPKLLAPAAATGEAVTLGPHKQLLDELNRYRGFQATNAWWDQLGDWVPVMSDEDGSVSYYERANPADGTMEYSYSYPVPPEPGGGGEDASGGGDDEFAYALDQEGSGEGYEGEAA
jgi:hypothetical protein